MFHLLAVTCVIWSLYVLIQRTALEIREKEFHWPFWTKLIVVAIGFVGGLVFMYVQCKVYVQLWRRLKAYNRVIYVQNNPTLTTTTATTNKNKTTEKIASSSSMGGASPVATSSVQCQQTTTILSRSEEDNNSKQIASKVNNSSNGNSNQRAQTVQDRDGIRCSMQFKAMSPAAGATKGCANQYQISFEDSKLDRSRSETLSMQIASENIASACTSCSFNLNNSSPVCGGKGEILIERPDSVSDTTTKIFPLRSTGAGLDENLQSDAAAIQSNSEFVVEMGADFYSNPPGGSDAVELPTLVYFDETPHLCSETSKKYTNDADMNDVIDDVDPKMTSSGAKMKQKGEHHVVVSPDDGSQDFTTTATVAVGLGAKLASATDV